jgi:sterol desaturase/sphingolipid hydroxylase (fatty acid hydroxylase superfamily)
MNTGQSWMRASSSKPMIDRKGPKTRAPLKWLIEIPDFHHWHHSSEREAIDRNYAAHFAFDYLFGGLSRHRGSKDRRSTFFRLLVSRPCR